MVVRKRKAKIVAYPANLHVIKLNVTLHNQSEDDVYDYVAKLQNLVQDKFPPGTEGAYEVDEVKRKGRR